MIKVRINTKLNAGSLGLRLEGFIGSNERGKSGLMGLRCSESNYLKPYGYNKWDLMYEIIGIYYKRNEIL